MKTGIKTYYLQFITILILPVALSILFLGGEESIGPDDHDSDYKERISVFNKLLGKIVFPEG